MKNNIEFIVNDIDSGWSDLSLGSMPAIQLKSQSGSVNPSRLRLTRDPAYYLWGINVQSDHCLFPQ